MKNLLFILSVSISGCAKPFEISMRGTIDPEFIPFVKQFIIEAESQGKKYDLWRLNTVNIIFDESMKYPLLGICNISTAGLTIRINKTAWSMSSLESKELRLFHELGHCVLDIRDHRNAQTAIQDYNNIDGTVFYGPASLMNAYEVSGVLYVSNRDYYIRELFNHNDAGNLYYNGPSQFNINNY